MMLAVRGAPQLVQHPGVFKALNPCYACPLVV